jgi:hypothetical protein
MYTLALYGEQSIWAMHKRHIAVVPLRFEMEQVRLVYYMVSAVILRLALIKQSIKIGFFQAPDRRLGGGSGGGFVGDR